MKSPKLDICDFHAHILPKADHGSSSLAVSLKQLAYAEKYGVQRIVATPHYYPHASTVESFIKKRDASFAQLAPQIPPSISIRLGAEVLLCDNLENLPDLELLCIGRSNIILLELPYSGMVNSHIYTIANIIEKGFKVVLAHAERYDTSIIDEIISLGVGVQINAYTFANKISKGSSLERWLSQKSVLSLGSDIHNIDKKAYSLFYKAIQKHAEAFSSIKQSSDILWNSFSKPLL